MNNLLARVITAIIGVAILIGAIFYSQWAYMIVFLLICLLSVNEFYQLGKKSGKKPFMIWGLWASAFLFCLTFLMGTDAYQLVHFLAFLAFLSSIFGIAIFRKNKEDLVSSISYSVMGVIYIALPLSLLNLLAFPDGSYHFELIIGLLFCQWANDTGGYFVGRAIGKTKLYESVSPKKTVEGAIGGLLLALIISAALSYIFPKETLIEWLGLAAIVAVFGSIGDLAESLIKRNLAIKDSGKSLPGHGGFLDRFDGLFLALPFATLYIHLII